MTWFHCMKSAYIPHSNLCTSYIAGSIAEPYFGIPESMRSAALAYLDKEQRSIVERFEALYGAKVLAS